MGKSSKKKDRKANLSMTDSADLADSSGTVTPAQPGTVHVTPTGTSPTGAGATPKRLVFAPAASLIASPSIDRQTSIVPVLQSLQDLVTVLCGFLAKDGFVEGSKSDEVQE